MLKKTNSINPKTLGITSAIQRLARTFVPLCVERARAPLHHGMDFDLECTMNPRSNLCKKENTDIYCADPDMFSGRIPAHLVSF